MLTCSMLVSCNPNEPTPEELKQKALSGGGFCLF